MAGRGFSRAAPVFPPLDHHPGVLVHGPPPPAAGAIHPHHAAALIHAHRPAALMDDPLRHLPSPHPHPIEERLAMQQRDINALLLDNQRLAATHVALQQELNGAQHELRLLASSAARARAERDAEMRDAADRAARMEHEARGLDSMRAELAQVRADVQQLGDARNRLAEQRKELGAELGRGRSELDRAAAVREEVEAMHHEIHRGRAAIDYEKKIRSDNLEQSEKMEKNMITMAREVEKLRAELGNAEKKARAAAAANPGPAYAAGYSNTDAGHGGMYSDPYGMRSAYAGGADGGSMYGAGSAMQYNVQQAHPYR